MLPSAPPPPHTLPWCGRYIPSIHSATFSIVFVLTPLKSAPRSTQWRQKYDAIGSRTHSPPLHICFFFYFCRIVYAVSVWIVNLYSYARRVYQQPAAYICFTSVDQQTSLLLFVRIHSNCHERDYCSCFPSIGHCGAPVTLCIDMPFADNCVRFRRIPILRCILSINN